MTRRAAGITAGSVAGLALAAALWSAIAGWVFVLGTGLTAYYPFPSGWNAWWLYKLYSPPSPIVRHWLLNSAALALGCVVCFLIGFVSQLPAFRSHRVRRIGLGETPRAPQRAASGLHGTANWMKKSAAYLLFPGPSGVVVGEIDGHLLIDPCESGPTHGVVVAGSGTGKTSGITVPCLDTWSGSCVVFDPSCQVGDMAMARREEMGQSVVMVGPGGDGFNVLEWIDPADPIAETYVWAALEWIGGSAKGGGDNKMFVANARNLEAAILADMLWDPDLPPEKRTLREFRRRLCTSEEDMQPFLAQIHNETRSALARDLSGQLMAVYGKTFSGVYSHATTETAWLSTPAFADMVSGSSFSASDLCRGNLTAFVQIPMDVLSSTPGVARTVIGALLKAVYLAQGSVEGRILFLLDEARFLGRLLALADARDAGRKYGITVITMWQSLASMADIWGDDGPSSFFASASWRLFSGVSDHKTADLVSLECGEYTAVSYSESRTRNQGSWLAQGRTFSVSEQGRRLIMPDEVMQLGDGEAILIARGQRAIRCQVASYYKRPDMAARFGADRFHTAA